MFSSRRNLSVVFAIAVGAAGCATASAPPGTSGAAKASGGPSYTNLLDPSLSGWQGLAADPKQRVTMTPEDLATAKATVDAELPLHWKMEGDVLAHDGKGTNLVTRAEYGDVELVMEWKIDKLGDSGVYMRGTPQIQIWDPDQPGGEAKRAPKGSGGLWNNAKHANDPLIRADRPLGQWNTFRIRMVGERIWVWLNDQLVVDRTPLEGYWDKTRPVPARGPIELQTHQHPIWFRNIAVRAIEPEEAVRLLTVDNEASFASIWNGRDLSQWKGDVANYEIVDEAIRCKDKKGGTLYSEAEFGDFVARVEFKLPPGGNNGLAIRYPGQGNAAYVGMCELQVLDSEDPKYSKLDKRQYHGSAYGMVAAHRGYLRPTGLWNFEEVTVKGSTIKVELNGTTILETDLSTARDFMDGHPHPDRGMTRGHFGFAGHNDPVAFRKIRLKRLD